MGRELQVLKSKLGSLSKLQDRITKEETAEGKERSFVRVLTKSKS